MAPGQSVIPASSASLTERMNGRMEARPGGRAKFRFDYLFRSSRPPISHVTIHDVMDQQKLRPGNGGGVQNGPTVNSDPQKSGNLQLYWSDKQNKTDEKG